MAITVPKAHAKTRPAMSCFTSLRFFVITVTTIIEPALVKATHPSPPSKLFLYVHADFISPDSTANVVLGYNGNATGFGAIRVYDWVVREGEAADSPVLGQTAGQATVLRDGSLYQGFAYVLDTPSYAGTITLQGIQVPFQDGEAVITGGTGDFRWARGYTEIRTVSTENPKDVVFSGTLYIKYD